MDTSLVGSLTVIAIDQSNEHTGTFGQTIPWNLYDPATYQHPAVPLDVLTDPRSLPVNQTKPVESNDSDKEAAQVRISFSSFASISLDSPVDTNRYHSSTSHD